MSDENAEIDELLAEVNALASEAVAEIGGAAALEQAASGGGGGVAVALAPAAARRASVPVHGNRENTIQRVLHLEVPVIVRLAERSMPLSEILNLTSGAIIEFDKPADAELDLLINNKCIARGLAVKVGENFGLRINQIGTVQERIRALAG